VEFIVAPFNDEIICSIEPLQINSFGRSVGRRLGLGPGGRSSVVENKTSKQQGNRRRMALFLFYSYAIATTRG